MRDCYERFLRENCRAKEYLEHFRGETGDKSEIQAGSSSIMMHGAEISQIFTVNDIRFFILKKKFVRNVFI